MHVVRLHMWSWNLLNLLYPRYPAYAEQPLSTCKADCGSVQHCIPSTDHVAIITRQNLVGANLHSSRNISMGLKYMMGYGWPMTLWKQPWEGRQGTPLLTLSACIGKWTEPQCEDTWYRHRLIPEILLELPMC